MVVVVLEDNLRGGSWTTSGWMSVVVVVELEDDRRGVTDERDVGVLFEVLLVRALRLGRW